VEVWNPPNEGKGSPAQNGGPKRKIMEEEEKLNFPSSCPN